VNMGVLYAAAAATRNLGLQGMKIAAVETAGFGIASHQPQPQAMRIASSIVILALAIGVVVGSGWP